MMMMMMIYVICFGYEAKVECKPLRQSLCSVFTLCKCRCLLPASCALIVAKSSNGKNAPMGEGKPLRAQLRI